jgi:hypothetical protein
VVRHIFQACPVWIYTQSNITSIFNNLFQFEDARQRVTPSKCNFCLVFFQISYDDPIDDYYAKAVNSHFINGHHGRGQTNDVALGVYPQQ